MGRPTNTRFAPGVHVVTMLAAIEAELRTTTLADLAESASLRAAS
jgi:hypothetical protein